MGFEFIQFSPTLQEKTDHFKRTFCRRATCVDEDQQASDDRRIGLNLDSIVFGAQDGQKQKGQATLNSGDNK